jgi:type IV secretory pathway VirB10-like protein
MNTPGVAMSRFGGITLLVLVLVSAASPASAQWMWRDKAKGDQVTYSDRPPPAHVADKDILKRPQDSRRAVSPPAPAASAATSDASPAPGGVDPALEAKRKEAEKQAAAKKKQEEDQQAAARAENCKRSKKHLLALESGARMSQTNAQGEQEPMDDKGRATEVQRARSVIAAECK